MQNQTNPLACSHNAHTQAATPARTPTPTTTTRTPTPTRTRTPPTSTAVPTTVPAPISSVAPAVVCTPHAATTVAGTLTATQPNNANDSSIASILLDLTRESQRSSNQSAVATGVNKRSQRTQICEPVDVQIQEQLQVPCTTQQQLPPPPAQPQQTPSLLWSLDPVAELQRLESTVHQRGVRDSGGNNASFRQLLSCLFPVVDTTTASNPPPPQIIELQHPNSQFQNRSVFQQPQSFSLVQPQNAVPPHANLCFMTPQPTAHSTAQNSMTTTTTNASTNTNNVANGDNTSTKKRPHNQTPSQPRKRPRAPRAGHSNQIAHAGEPAVLLPSAAQPSDQISSIPPPQVETNSKTENKRSNAATAVTIERHARSIVLALEKFGAMGLEHVCVECDVPERQAYDVLNVLNAIGLVERKPRPPSVSKFSFMTTAKGEVAATKQMTCVYTFKHSPKFVCAETEELTNESLKHSEVAANASDPLVVPDSTSTAENVHVENKTPPTSDKTSCLDLADALEHEQQLQTVLDDMQQKLDQITHDHELEPMTQTQLNRVFSLLEEKLVNFPSVSRDFG